MQLAVTGFGNTVAPCVARKFRYPVRSTEIPQNDIKKPDLFGSGFLWRRSRDLCFSGV